MLYFKVCYLKVIPYNSIYSFIILKFKKITMLKNYIYSFIVILVSFLFIFISCADPKASDTNPPTIINDTLSFSVNEDASLNFNVGQVEASDDSGSVFFDIAQGDPDEQFTIDEEGNIIIVKTLDFETTPIYTLTINVFDSDNNTSTATVTINVQNVEDEAPTIINDTLSFSVNEDASLNFNIGQVRASDDSGSVFFDIAQGDPDAQFAIDEAGNITIAKALDFETTPIYTLTVSVSDPDGNTSTVTVTINVQNIDEEAPTIADQTFDIPEEPAFNSIIGTVVAQDNIGIVSYSIIGINPTAAEEDVFLDIQNDGKIRAFILNFERLGDNTNFDLIIEVSDAAGNTASGTITINVIDIIEMPVISAQSFSVIESAANGSTFGTVIADTTTGGNSIANYAIISGNDDGKFAIHNRTGELTKVGDLDASVTPSYTLEVEVTDDRISGNKASADITITVITGNSPTISFDFFTIDENVANGTAVGTVTASDSDGSITAYNIIAGNDVASFAINTSTGEITTAGELDFERIPLYDLTVEVTDNEGLRANSRIRVIVNNLDEENPTITASQTFNVDEESPNGTIVGTVIASDDIGITTYTISAGNTGTVFAIDNDGVITVIDNIDYEAPSTIFTLTIEVSDAAANATSAYTTIAINDVNDTLPRIFADTFEVNEQAPSGTSIGTVMASDDNTITAYSITAGDDDSKFAISSTGEITTADALDFETTPSYTLTVEVTDNDGNKVSDDFAINVINDQPPFAIPFFFSVNENIATGTTVGTISATDDFGTVAFAITSGNDDGNFAINASTGEITTAGTIDFETTAQYVLTISITDSTEGNVITPTVTIDVNNLEDASPTIANQMVTINENLPINSLIYQVIASDDTAVTAYSIMSGDSDNLFTINASTGQITTKAAIDYESLTDTDKVYTLVIQVSDAAVNTSTGNLEITVNNIVDEGMPIVLPGQVFVINSTPAMVGDLIGTVVVSDDGSIVSYAITNVSTNPFLDLFSINNNGEITLSSDGIHSGNSVAFSVNNAILSIKITDNDGNSTSGTVTVMVFDNVLGVTNYTLPGLDVANVTGTTIGNGVLWVVNNKGSVENKVRAYNTADLSENTTLDFDLTHNNPDATDIIFALDKLWVLDDDDTVYAYNQDGSRDQASDFSIDTEGTYQGITFVNNQFWVVNHIRTRVYNLDGTEDLTKGFLLVIDNENSKGITFYDNHFLVLNSSKSSATASNHTILAYTSDGAPVINRNINLPNFVDSSDSGNLFYSSAVINANDILIITLQATGDSIRSTQLLFFDPVDGEGVRVSLE